MSDELQNTVEWFKQAIPEPTIEQACIQVGCHIEEFSEMLWALGVNSKARELDDLAEFFKSCDEQAIWHIKQSCKIELLDSIVDQKVTATGIAHMMGFDLLGALTEVNRSNFSKFEDGKPVFDVNGKITKGKDYTPPNLSGMIGK